MQACEFKLHIQGMRASVIPLANLIEIYLDKKVERQIFEHI